MNEWMKKIHDLLFISRVSSRGLRSPVSGSLPWDAPCISRWASVWRKSRLKIPENSKNYLFWLIIHRVTRVQYALKVWGLEIMKSDKCAFCSRVETTVEHRFYLCRRAHRVWNFFFFLASLSRLLNSFLRSQPLQSFSLFLMYNRLTAFLCPIIFGQQLSTGFGMLVMCIRSDFLSCPPDANCWFD